MIEANFGFCLFACVNSRMTVLYHHVKNLHNIFTRCFSTVSFPTVDSLPISNFLKMSLNGLGIMNLTRVQSEIFGPILCGKSLVGVAKTGTGKTFSYLIPLIARMENERFGAFSALIIVPTRELCQQVGSVLIALNPSLNTCLAFGKPTPQFDLQMKHGPHVIVGTSGRIASLIRRGDIDTARLKIMVIDELDSLLTEDYRDDVRKIMHAAVGSCQVIGIGATMDAQLEKILKADKIFLNPSCVTVNLLDSTVAYKKSTTNAIAHQLIKVALPLRVSVINVLLNTRKFRKCIIFVKNLNEAKNISLFPSLQSKVDVLHGELPQSDRDGILSKFRVQEGGVLVCTDIASRGIDVPNVDLVINYTLPMDKVGYIHRSGRTGRAGTTGTSIVFCSSKEEEVAIQKFCVPFEKTECPSKLLQRRIAIDTLVNESLALHEKGKLFEFAQNLIETKPTAASQLTMKCINTLLGNDDVSSFPKQSILTGEPGHVPLLFIDPTKKEIKSRADVLEICNGGYIALSESGYIVDLPISEAIRIFHERQPNCQILDKLPKLVIDDVYKGRKFNGVIPWRREKTSSKKK